MMNSQSRSRLCDRCLAEIAEGRGQFYEVRIEVVSDPTPPVIDEQLEGGQLQQQYVELVEQLQEVSPREAMDQVYRRRVWTLCNQCLEHWFNDPFGPNQTIDW